MILLGAASKVLAWGVLLSLIPLGPVLGSAGSIIASLLAILLIPAVLRPGLLGKIARQPALVAYAAVFLLLALCFSITALQPRDALFALNFISLPLAAVVFAVAARPATAAAAAQTLAVLCLAGALSALVVAANDIFLRGLSHVYGFNMGPHVASRLALTLGFVSLVGVFVTRSPWRYILYLGPIAALLVTVLSGTRGALLAVPGFAMVFATFLWLNRSDRRQLWWMAAAAALALAGLLVASDRFASLLGLLAKLASGQAVADGSANERLQMLSAAWELFQQSPIIGHGWAHFAALAHPIIGSIVWGGADDRWFQFHNDLANFAVAAGLVGVVCWLALLAAPVAGALASPRDSLFRARLYVCVQLSVSYFVFGLTDFTLGYDLPTTLYAFLTAIVLGALRDPMSPPQEAAPALRRAA